LANLQRYRFRLYEPSQRKYS